MNMKRKIAVKSRTPNRICVDHERWNRPIRRLSWMINLNFLNGRTFNISPSYQKPIYRRNRLFFSPKQTDTHTQSYTFVHKNVHLEIEGEKLKCGSFQRKVAMTSKQQHINNIVMLNRLFFADVFLFFLVFFLNWYHAQFVVRCVILGRSTIFLSGAY